MDASQWPQGMGLQVMNSMILGDQFTSSAAAAAAAAKPPQVAEREMRERQRPRQKPSMEQALHCPRCKSTNTKFCYYNNYSLTQPRLKSANLAVPTNSPPDHHKEGKSRYFCKTCRRYWTEGGSLRNVPVGGGSRKNKNKTVTAAAVTPAATAAAAPSSKAQKLFPELNTIWQESSSNSYNLSAMDMLKSSTAVPVPMPMTDYAGAGFEGLMQEFMRPPAISFPPDSAAGGSNLMFPLEEQNKGQGGGGGDSANGYWSGNGMLMGGRGSW